MTVVSLIGSRWAVGGRDWRWLLRLDICDSLGCETQARLAANSIEHAARDFIGDLRGAAGIGRVTNNYLEAGMAEKQPALRLGRFEYDIEIAFEAPKFRAHAIAITREHFVNGVDQTFFRQPIVGIGRKRKLDFVPYEAGPRRLLEIVACRLKHDRV